MPGHDRRWRQELVLGAMLTVGSEVSAFAHNSLAPHEHPHETSMLPDMFALLFAALLVGLGFVALRRFRKE